MRVNTRTYRSAARMAAMAVPALVILMSLACADNPADGVAPAEVSEAAAPVPPPAEGDVPTGAPAEPAEVADASIVYAINPQNSKIEFECSKVTRSHVGGFNDFSGEIRLAGDSPENAALDVVIQTDSIWTDTEQLTGHLKSPDFFEVETHPQSTFELTDVSKTDAGYDISGNFTLHGVTKRITFPAQIEVMEEHVRASSEFVIDRFDFGIEYPGKADDLIRREVVIRLDIQAQAAEA